MSERLPAIDGYVWSVRRAGVIYPVISEAEARLWAERDSGVELIRRAVGPWESAEIGPAVDVRFEQAMLDEIDGQAKSNGLSRAAMIRKLVDEALVCPARASSQTPREAR